MSDLVTGEAVVLELRLAKLASRTLARLVDLAVQGALLLAGTTVVAGLAASLDSAAAAAIVLVLVLAVVVGYPVAYEALSRGRTVGKHALGLRVVREDGGPIRFRHAFVRGLLGVVEIWLSLGAIALVVSLASTRGKRLGDFLAGTVVVRDRVPAPSPALATMPPALSGWAGGLDLSALPDDLALAARAYLSRVDDLAPEVRTSMGGRLARAVAARTSPPAPAGVPDQLFLAAVLAERRRRESARLASPGSPYAGATGPAGPPSPYAGPAGPPSPYAGPARPATPYAGPAGPPSPSDAPDPTAAADNPFAPPG